MEAYHCYVCETSHPAEDMVPYGEWNADARRTLNLLACPCGEREDIVEAFECDSCETLYPESRLDDGNCFDCAAHAAGEVRPRRKATK